MPCAGPCACMQATTISWHVCMCVLLTRHAERRSISCQRALPCHACFLAGSEPGIAHGAQRSTPTFQRLQGIPPHAS